MNPQPRVRAPLSVVLPLFCAVKNRIPRKPAVFVDKLVKKNELGQPFKLMDHQREILRLPSPSMNDSG
jgi:hypothetical protein